MRAWVVAKSGPITGGPLELTDDRPGPEPGPGQLQVKLIACGGCRTDLHLAEGDLPPPPPDTAWGTGSGRRGGPACTGRAGSAAAARRTSAPAPPTPAGTSTADTP